MTNLNKKRNEQGNALFLILIAVVLFAALSYAITQSNRGGGAPNRETSLISSTTVTQYSSAIRTGVTRMMLRNTEITDIDFLPPVVTTFTSTATNEHAPLMLFHPDGGGVSYAPVDVNTVGTVEDDTTDTALYNDWRNGNWHFIQAAVNGIGTTSVDLVAVLADVKKPLCERINEQITGKKDIPAVTIGTLSKTGVTTLATEPLVLGQSFLCVGPTNGPFNYYHVIAEQ